MSVKQEFALLKENLSSDVDICTAERKIVLTLSESSDIKVKLNQCCVHLCNLQAFCALVSLHGCFVLVVEL